MSARARLVWNRQGAEPMEFALDEEAVEVGRDEGVGVRIDEPLVSRRHARIERRGDAWIVVDLASTNFTRVNGARVHRECELADGDTLAFGRATCVFRAEGTAEGRG